MNIKVALFVILFMPIMIFAGGVYDDEFNFIIRTPIEDSVVNYSFLNHKPAGKFGYLTIRNGDFFFANDKKVRWFGLNIVDNRLFNMTNNDADLVARKLAALGVNIVRIHHLTAAWQVTHPFFVNRKKSALEFNDKALERLDYFIAALKKEGIYITAELIDSAFEIPALESPDKEKLNMNQVKILLMIDPQIQKYAKEYIKKFYTRNNRYTGTSLFNDPQFAMLGLVNEISMGYHNGALQYTLRPFYMKRLQNRFEQWLAHKGLPKSEFALRWDDEYSARFWNETLKDSYKMWSDYVRQLGFKGVISGSNFAENFFHIVPSLSCDFMDTHLYWGGYAGWEKKYLESIENKRFSVLLKKPVNEGGYTKNLFARFSLGAVSGKPFISSEHRTAPGAASCDFGKDVNMFSEFRAVDLPFFATIQAFQDWDGFYVFASQGTEKINQSERMGHILDVRYDTTYLGTFPLASYILRGQVIQPANKKILMTISENDIYKNSSATSFNNDALFGLPEKHQIRLLYPGMECNIKDYNEVISFDKSKALYNSKNVPYLIEADTDQFYRNWKEGFFVLNTPCVQGIEGFFDKTKTFSLNNIKFDMVSNFGVCFVAARNLEKITDAKRMMFLVVGECRNTPPDNKQTHANGWYYPGKQPVLVSPVKGTLSFNNNDKYTFWVLGENGERISKVAENVSLFQFDTGRDKTIWYEISK
jgi:hypothetical protein